MNQLVLSAPTPDHHVCGYRQRTESTMGRLLTVPFERVATRRTPHNSHRPNIFSSASLQYRSEVLPNPETIAEQKRHLTTSMSLRAHSTSVTTSSVRMQRPSFPYTTSLEILRQIVLAVVTAYPHWKLGPNKGRWCIPCASKTSVSASCLTTVNAIFCSWDPCHRPPRPCPPESSGEPHFCN